MKTITRNAARALAMAALLVVPATGLFPATGLAKDRKAPDGLDDVARREAAARGIDYLEKEVPRLPDSSGTPRREFTQAVAGLCFLLDERTSDGDRARIAKVKDALLRYLDDVEGRLADPDELPEKNGVFSSDRLIQYTWPVAAAGLFFGEMHERGLHKADSLEALSTIVGILERSQQANGGWGHHVVRGAAGPGADDASDRLRKELEKRLGEERARRHLEAVAAGGGYPDTLVSSSNLVAGTLGLLSGLLGRSSVGGLDEARAYFRAAPLDDGVFPYDPSQRKAHGDGTAAGRGAGALWAWQTLGMAQDEQWDLCRGFVMERLADVPEGHGSPCLNLLYGALATQAMGAEEFRAFRVANEARIIATQKEDGSLHCTCEKKHFAVTCDSEDRFGGAAPGFAKGQDVYTTALDTLVLLLPQEGLRLSKRKPRPTAAPTMTPR